MHCILTSKRAFDKIPHCRLLSKTNGIDGRVKQSTKSWLSARQQRVFINVEISDWSPVVSSVPLGSVFGQLIFITFIFHIDDEIGDIKIRG